MSNRRDWAKWGMEFWLSVMRHTGTAGLTVAATFCTTGHIEPKKLLLALLTGGIMPSVFTALQNPPVEETETTTLTTKTTLTKTTTDTVPEKI